MTTLASAIPEVRMELQKFTRGSAMAEVLCDVLVVLHYLHNPTFSHFHTNTTV